MTDIPYRMTVHCHNAVDGCTNTITFYGVRPVRKLCVACLECGTPHERTGAGFASREKVKKSVGRVADVKCGCYSHCSGEADIQIDRHLQSNDLDRGRIFPKPAAE